MPERLQDKMVPLKKRQAYLAALPCFSSFPEKSLKHLAESLQEIHYRAGECIVEQGALVDGFYIIVHGQAEVSREFIKKRKLSKRPKKIIMPVAALGPSEPIGLNETGFYSSTGKRVATVTALTEMILLRLGLKEFYEFFNQYPELKDPMYAATVNMLRMHLIKQSLPFSHLSHDRLAWLAAQVKEITVAPNEIIFKQGEVGDCCYLVRAGQVEIQAEENSGGVHALAVLQEGTLFGEATLITQTRRNATARALGPCQLLVLRYEYLTELLESEKNVANMVMALMVDRSRPMQNPAISVHERMSEDGQKIIILKDPAHNQYFKLSPEGWFVWQQLDGKKTMQEITMGLADQFNIFAPDVVAALLSKLAKAGFIENIQCVQENSGKSQSFWVRAMLYLKKILEYRVAIGDADRWLSPFYNRFGHMFFSRWAKIILPLIACSGGVVFIMATPLALHLFKSISSVFWVLVLLVPGMAISVLLHELGHALATKYFGFEVHYMGVGWYWFGPVAFTDTSDMWLGAKGPRIFVNLAGPFTDLVTAALASFFIFIVQVPTLQCVLWIFALYTYINAFRMLSPLQDFDGYYVLMDLFDRPKLRKSSIIWLLKTFPKSCRDPKLFLKHGPEVSYWLACLVFLVLISWLTIWAQGLVFKMMGVPSSHWGLSLILPFVIVVVSSLGVLAEVRSQAE